MDRKSTDAGTLRECLFLSAVGRPGLEAGTPVLPGHTSEPGPFGGKPIPAPLSRVREGVPLLDEEAFVEKIAGRVVPTPRRHRCAAG